MEHSHDHSHSHSHSHKHAEMPGDFEKYIDRFEDSDRDSYQHFDQLWEATRTLSSKTTGMIGADVGGGSGYIARKMAATGMFSSVFSVDINEAMTEWAKRKLQEGPEDIRRIVEPILGQSDGFHVPNDGKCDFIMQNAVLHHLDDVSAYFLRLAEKNANPLCILLVIDFKPGKNIRNGKEFGPKEEWNVKISPEKTISMIEGTGKWEKVHSIDMEFHYNLFFKVKL